ncbi:MAG: AraC family transcriptional regulator [Saprospiraceae bacterium]
MKESFQLKELNVQGHARVWNYSCNPGSTIDLQAVPLEILLFCVKQGRICLQVSFIPHPVEIGSSEAIFLAFPRDEWHAKALTQVDAEFYVMCMDVSFFHKMINPAFDEHQLDTSHRINMRDLMRLIPVNPSMMICFDQLMHHKLKHPFNQIFERAKFLEIFSLLMESAFSQPMDACPVAMSTVIESKLQKVRRHIIAHLDEAPDPDTLAVMYELPRNTLKEGYRYVYGKTIHQYHTDHKLESAMQMLNEGELLVKEVAFRIGYQNPSHFIAAFKKKYGYTPKQYLKREGVALSL